MSMESSSDYAMNDTTRNYCRFCCNEDGSMQSYERKLESMTQYMISAKKIDKDRARQLAREIMSKLPAWSARNS
jgi:hypothetical protein